MIPLIGAALAALGALAVLLARGWPRGACLAGAVALSAVTAAVVAMPVEPPLALGDAQVVDTALVRVWISALTGTLAVLVIVTLLVAPAAGVPMQACVLVAVTCLALSISEPVAALMLASCAGILVLAGTGGAWRGAFRQRAVVPAMAVGAVLLASLAFAGGGADGAAGAVAAGAALGAESTAGGGGPAVLTAILVAGTIALAVGAVPLHVLPLRTARAAPLATLPMTSIWTPYLLGLLAVAWAATSPAAGILEESVARDILAIVGGVTIVLAALAMLVQDDLGSLLGVHAIADGALILLALTGGAAALPALVVWLLVSGLARTALAAWAVAVTSRMGGHVAGGQLKGGRRIAETRGWIRRAPLLLPGLVVPVAAGIGWPGSPPFEARLAIVGGAMPETAALLVAGASMALALGYLRLVWLGIRPADEATAVPVGPRRRAARWSAAGLVLALGAIPLVVAMGFIADGLSGPGAAVAEWRPFQER